MASKTRKIAGKSGNRRNNPSKKAVLSPKSNCKTVAVQRGSRVSVVVKIVFFSAIIYQAAIVSFLVLQRLFGFVVPAEIAGVSSGTLSIIFRILIFSGAVTLATRKYLISPLNEIKDAIKEAGRGDFLVKAEVDATDEIGDLAGDFNEMLEKISELDLERRQTEYELTIVREKLKAGDSVQEKESAVRKLNSALEALVKEFYILYDIGQKVNSTIEMSELFGLMQDVVPKSLALQRFAILLVDDNREFLSVCASSGFEDPERMRNLTFRVGEGISGEVAKTGELIYLPDVETDSRFLHYRGESIEKGSFLCVPLKYKNNVLGVMNCSRKVKNGFLEDEVRILTMVANQIALAVANAKLYTKTRELSVRDELTGLYNRRHFQQVMQMEWKRATRFRRPLSLIMVDIDHFKIFNDTFGHLHGDRVLQTIAKILSKNLREVDMAARFGGEEFIILLPDTDREGAMVVGEKLRRLVEMERFDEGQRQIQPLTISAGISVFPEDAREMDDLIDHADVALYEAKDSGRNRICVYPGTARVSSGFNRPTLIKS